MKIGIDLGKILKRHRSLSEVVHRKMKNCILDILFFENRKIIYDEIFSNL